ncbi:MAG TPA: acyl-CoA dehydrogenase family protein [Rugosimonospora sp.]|nr:acyl-CoA dehydrogenase family protein [Rugosimonospora sp.]
MVDRTGDEQAFAESVREFARERLAGDALRRAHEPGYAWDAAGLLAKQGLLGLTLPESDGGQGAELMYAVIAIQEIAKACPKSGDVVQATSFGAIRTLAEYASPDLKARYLPGLLAGESLLALAMSEPEAGSATTQLRTSAVIEGDTVVVNGSKVFSTNSPEATAFLVYVRFGPGTDGIGSVIVDRDAPGLTIGEPSSFMNGEQWCQLYFDDCRVPAGNVVLGQGGFRKQIRAFNVERLGNAARALALGQLAFDMAREHASTREQFGRKLCEFQGLQWMFADMAMQLDGAQLLLERAARHASTGLPDAYETSVAKLACNLAGFSAANQAVQIMGATGYSQESLVEYCLRRTRGWMIAGGSIEMLKNRIAESVFDRRFDQRPPRTAP